MPSGHRNEGWSGVFSDLDAEDVADRTVVDEDAEPTDPGLGPPPQLQPAAFPPEPDPAPTTGAPPIARSAEPATFSEERLLQTLEPAADTRVEESTGFWREYRELIVTAVLGISILALALWWSGLVSPTPESARPTHPEERIRPEARSERREPARRTRDRPSRAPAATAPGGSTVEARRRSGPREAREAPRRSEAKLPMLTVVSRPGGAMVEIDGVVYGRTPLIIQAPPDRSRFDVQLRLDDHRTWSGVLTKDDAGHFSLNVTLEPFEP